MKKNEQKYESWEPLANLPEFYECYARDYDDGLELLLFTGEKDERTLSMRFEGHVPAYRQIVEECRLATYARSVEAKGQLWRVKESSWLKEFGEVDLIFYSNLNHYLIETGNQCFDVLSDSDPVVEWKK